MKDIPKYLQEKWKGTESKDDYDSLLKLNEGFIKEHPEDRECLLAWQVSFLRSAKRYEECINLGNEVAPSIEDEDYKSSIKRLVAYSLDNAERFEEAIEAYKGLGSEDDPTSDYEYIAAIYEKLGDEEKATHYEELLAAEDDDSELCEKLSKKFEDKKDYEKAIFYMARCARILPHEGDYFWSYVGRLYALTGNIEEGMFYFKMAMQINPEFADSYFLMGRCYEENGDTYRALSNYYKALEYRPDYPEVYTNLGAMKYNEEGDIQRAIQFMETALKKKPDTQLKQSIFINLVRLNKQIADYDRQEYYNAKLLQLLGFPVEFDREGDIDEDDDSDTGEDDDVSW